MFNVTFALLVALMLSWSPLAFLLYPVKILTTSIHELSHALMAIATGADVHELVINSDASGHVLSSGGWVLGIASAGYLGSTLFGCFGLWLIAKLKSGVNIVWTAVLCTVLYVFFFATVEGFARLYLLVLLGISYIIAIGWVPDAAKKLGGLLVCVLIGSNALFDLQYLIALSSTSTHTDAQLAFSVTGVPPIIWSLTWSAIAVVATWTTLNSALRSK